VVADGIELDGRWYHNGQIFRVGQAKAQKRLSAHALATLGRLVRAPRIGQVVATIAPKRPELAIRPGYLGSSRSAS
jgi:hypothetical protein